MDSTLFFIQEGSIMKKTKTTEFSVGRALQTSDTLTLELRLEHLDDSDVKNFQSFVAHLTKKYTLDNMPERFH